MVYICYEKYGKMYTSENFSHFIEQCTTFQNYLQHFQNVLEYDILINNIAIGTSVEHFQSNWEIKYTIIFCEIKSVFVIFSLQVGFLTNSQPKFPKCFSRDLLKPLISRKRLMTFVSGFILVIIQTIQQMKSSNQRNRQIWTRFLEQISNTIQKDSLSRSNYIVENSQELQNIILFINNFKIQYLTNM